MLFQIAYFFPNFSPLFWHTAMTSVTSWTLLGAVKNDLISWIFNMIALGRDGVYIYCAYLCQILKSLSRKKKLFNSHLVVLSISCKISQKLIKRLGKEMVQNLFRKLRFLVAIVLYIFAIFFCKFQMLKTACRRPFFYFKSPTFFRRYIYIFIRYVMRRFFGLYSIMWYLIFES